MINRIKRRFRRMCIPLKRETIRTHRGIVHALRANSTFYSRWQVKWRCHWHLVAPPAKKKQEIKSERNLLDKKRKNNNTEHGVAFDFANHLPRGPDQHLYRGRFNQPWRRFAGGFLLLDGSIGEAPVVQKTTIAQSHTHLSPVYPTTVSFRPLTRDSSFPYAQPSVGFVILCRSCSFKFECSGTRIKS